MSNELNLTSENFGQYINGEKPILIDFYANWCKPCKMMNPVIEDFSKKQNGKVIVGKVNVDEQPGIASRYEVMSIPTFILFRKGRPISAVIGAVSEPELERRLLS